MDLQSQIQSTLGDAFRVERELGGGGMSRVFVAAEVTLGRRIVVKVLPPDAAGQLSTERFKREIRVAAQLQHPHIVPLLSAGDTNGLPYYTMPYVQGETLRERLSRADLSVRETIHVLRDVASALAYAHGNGVVHRDIKPENIILSGGVAVVTDFGVAKALAAGGSQRPERTGARDLSTASLTSLGIALGTPAYMAPEQAAADPNVDHRADIYAFGCVAYEMLTGASPFAGRPLAQILAAHVQEQPVPIETKRPLVPAALGRLVLSCLEKLPEHRPQSATALLAALDAIDTPSDGSAPTGARRPGRRGRGQRILMVAGGAIVVALGAGALWLARQDRGAEVVRPGRVTSVATTLALEMDPEISPDGKFVAYVAGLPGSYHIRVRQIAGERSVDVSAELPGEHTQPAWSPDGSQVAFVGNGSVYVVAATGGTPKRLVETSRNPILDVAWSPNGRSIAYTTANGLWVKLIAGGAMTAVVENRVTHSPAWSPDGTRLAYVEGIPATLENMSAAPVKIVDLATRAVVTVTKNNAVNLSPAWAPDGRAIYYTSSAQGTLDVYRQLLTRDGQPRDSAQRITAGLSARHISLSSDGTRMAYDVVRNRSNIWALDIPAGAAVASMAAAHQITSDNQRIEGISLSHDGKWLAYDSDRSGNADIYRIRIDGGDPVQVTTDPRGDFAPSWSPDDKRILFHSNRTGSRELYSIGVDGNDEQQLTDVRNDLYAPQLSADGTRLFAFSGSEARRGPERYDVVFDRDASGRWVNMRRITPPNVEARWFRLSWDGDLLAYVTHQPGLAPGLGAAVRVSTADGRDDHAVFDLRPREYAMFVAFGRNPKTVFVVTRGDDRRFSVYSVPVAGGAPRLVVRDDPTHRISRWDFATDGQRLFFTVAADESDVYLMELNR